MNTVPIIVPTMNSANIPLASGELNPYLSTTTATSGSRPMEFVKPIDSRLNPKSKATGSAIKLLQGALTPVTLMQAPFPIINVLIDRWILLILLLKFQ